MPVVTLTKSNVLVNNNYIISSNPSTIYNTQTSLQLGMDGSGNTDRALLKFDLGLIPNNVIINSAMLNLYQVTAPSGTNAPFSLHAITSDWVEASTSWSNQPSFSNTVKVDVTSPPATNSVAFTVDVKAIVDQWINSGLSNYGILLKNTTETGTASLRNIGSTRNATVAYQPTLTIDYTIPSTGKKQVEYVGYSTNTVQGSVNSFSVPIPSSVQAGDLLLASIYFGSTINTPTGWTQVVQSTLLNGAKFGIFSKVATSGEVSPVFTSSTNSAWFGTINLFRNVKSIIKNSVGTSNTSSVSPTTTTVIKQNTAFLLLSMANSVSNASATPPLSYQELYDFEFTLPSNNRATASMKYMYSDLDQVSSEMFTTFAATPPSSVSSLIVLEPVTNNVPTLTLTNPADNQTLAEGNTMPVAGEASDADNGNVVTVKYKINNGTARAIASGVSDGSSPLSFAKSLTYSNKRLWDGSTDVTGADLAENVDHVLTVWAEDDQGGKSAEITRKFRVSHNKPPAITVDAFTPVQSGLIPPDLITISGTVSDPDGNTVTVTGKANNGAPQTLLSGVSGGNWSFSFPVSALQEGGNTITITATDQFGSSTVKTFNVNNAITKTPLDKGVARYKVTPPLGAAKEILAWMQREIGDLSVDGAASFVDAGQSEQYMTMAKSSVDLAHGIAEDEFVASVADPKADIVFKQTFTRTNTDSSESALKLVGVIE